MVNPICLNLLVNMDVYCHLGDKERFKMDPTQMGPIHPCQCWICDKAVVTSDGKMDKRQKLGIYVWRLEFQKNAVGFMKVLVSGALPSPASIHGHKWNPSDWRTFQSVYKNRNSQKQSEKIK